MPCGAAAAAKAMCLVAGMAAEAGCIEDIGLLRDGAMETVFGGVRAPSTLGSFLRSFTWGNVRQLDKAHRGLTAALAADPRLLPPGRRAKVIRAQLELCLCRSNIELRSLSWGYAAW
jgi:hypothetical protein